MSTILSGSYINNGIIDDTIDIDTASADITVGPFDPSNYQIDLSGLNSSITAPSSLSGYGNYGNITIGSTSAPYTYSTTANWGNNTVSGKLECEGENADVVINGKSLKDFMTKMEERLAILVPDPAKLEHFEALQKAYAHYKTLEALCELPKPEEK